MSETARRRAVVVGAVLAVQLLVPPLALRHDRPAALGWHMFVAVKPEPEVILVHRDGSEEEISMYDVLGRFRPEIDFVERLTPELCDRDGEIARVRYERGDEVLGERPC